MSLDRPKTHVVRAHRAASTDVDVTICTTTRVVSAKHGGRSDSDSEEGENGAHPSDPPRLGVAMPQPRHCAEHSLA